MSKKNKHSTFLVIFTASCDSLELGFRTERKEITAPREFVSRIDADLWAVDYAKRWPGVTAWRVEEVEHPTPEGN